MAPSPLVGGGALCCRQAHTRPMERITEKEVREEWTRDLTPANAAFGFYVQPGQCRNPQCPCNTAGQMHGPLIPHFEK